MAFCLGQMMDESALPILKKILENNSEDPIVRHEVHHCPPLFYVMLLTVACEVGCSGNGSYFLPVFYSSSYKISFGFCTSSPRDLRTLHRPDRVGQV